MLQFPLYIISFEDHDYECMPRSIFITESLDEAKNKALEFTLTKHTQFGDGFNITVNEVLNVQHDERTIFYFSNDERDYEEDRITCTCWKYGKSYFGSKQWSRCCLSWRK